MQRNSGIIRKRVVALLVVLAAAAGWVLHDVSSLEQRTRQDLAGRSVNTLLFNMSGDEKMDGVYVDLDDDLIADAPEEEALLAQPNELRFSFVAAEDSVAHAEVWQAVTDAISEKVGRPVKYLPFDEGRKQMAALRSGVLHVTAFDSGAVPMAVKHAGFVPLCTIGDVRQEGEPDDSPPDNAQSAEAGDDSEGRFGYRMQFIVKEDSPIKELPALRGKNIAFVRPNSNSGCKAAMVHLWQMGLRPEHDYNWHFSLSHENSARSVVDGRADAAPVASSILQRLVDKGVIQPGSFRVIYESALFPPVAIGCAYNLPEEQRQAIQAALLELDWADTKLAEEMAPGSPKQFVPVVYREDWASVRAVDQAVKSLRDQIAVQ